MKRTALIFTIVFSTSMVIYLFLRSFSSSEGGSFEVLGFSWIVLKSFYYGVFAIAMTCVIFGSEISTLKRSVFGMLVVLLIAMERTMLPNDQLRTSDRAIYEIGYSISRLFPYVAEDNDIPQAFPTALKQFEQVVAKTTEGVIKIKAYKGRMREICWDKTSRTLEPTLIINNLGEYLHFPPPSKKFLNIPFLSDEFWPGFFWKRHAGVSNCYYTERVLNFDSNKDALEWLKNGYHVELSFSCSADGLCVGWRRNLESLDIEICQVLINGKRPKKNCFEEATA